MLVHACADLAISMDGDASERERESDCHLLVPMNLFDTVTII